MNVISLARPHQGLSRFINFCCYLKMEVASSMIDCVRDQRLALFLLCCSSNIQTKTLTRYVNVFQLAQGTF